MARIDPEKFIQIENAFAGSAATVLLRTPTAHGVFTTRTKSPDEGVVPVPNMMTWIAGTTSAVSLTPPHSVKTDGNANKTAAAPAQVARK